MCCSTPEYLTVFVTPSWVSENVIQKLSGDHSGIMRVVGSQLLETRGGAEGIAGELMLADLIVCPVELYDFILGMDWLGKFKTHLDCYRGRVVYERAGRRLVYKGVRPVPGACEPPEESFERSCGSSSCLLN